MMQILPLLGTTALIGAAGYTVFLASQQNIADIPLIDGRQTEVQAGQTARQIQLVPDARDDAYYTAITDRPLFEQSRRPVTAVVESVEEVESEIVETPAPQAEIPTPDVQLLGVLAGGARTAALLSYDAEPPRWHSHGEIINGWTLSEIQADHVVFTENERELRVELYQR